MKKTGLAILAALGLLWTTVPLLADPVESGSFEALPAVDYPLGADSQAFSFGYGGSVDYRFNIPGVTGLSLGVTGALLVKPFLTPPPDEFGDPVPNLMLINTGGGIWWDFSPIPLLALGPFVQAGYTLAFAGSQLGYGMTLTAGAQVTVWIAGSFGIEISGGYYNLFGGTSGVFASAGLRYRMLGGTGSGRAAGQPMPQTVESIPAADYAR